MRPIKIGIIDDQKLFTNGIGGLLSKEFDFDLCIEACNGEDLKNKLDNNNLPDVLTLDTIMPIMDGIATAKWLRDEYPNIKVLVLTGSINSQTVLSMARLGVKGYLTKNCGIEELAAAIKTINEGMVYYPENVTRALVEALSDNQGIGALSLTEKEFLKLSATELTYKEIAIKMNITSRTADALRDQLFEKLKIQSRVGLALYAVKYKLIYL